jgi:hypothetical protein
MKHVEMHREKHRYTYVLCLIVTKLRKIPLFFPSCYYDIMWASQCQNIWQFHNTSTVVPLCITNLLSDTA